MGTFKPKEIKCTCLKCGWEWYAPAKEIHAEKRLRASAAKVSGNTISSLVFNRIHRKKLINKPRIYPLRCSKCGSIQVKQGF